MRVKCLAQEHSAMSRPGLGPGALAPESSTLTMRPPRLPQKTTGFFFSNYLLLVFVQNFAGNICQKASKSPALIGLSTDNLTLESN